MEQMMVAWNNGMAYSKVMIALIILAPMMFCGFAVWAEKALVKVKIK
jgi:hypothetical protein